MLSSPSLNLFSTFCPKEPLLALAKPYRYLSSFFFFFFSDPKFGLISPCYQWVTRGLVMSGRLSPSYKALVGLTELKVRSTGIRPVSQWLWACSTAASKRISGKRTSLYRWPISTAILLPLSYLKDLVNGNIWLSSVLFVSILTAQYFILPLLFRTKLIGYTDRIRSKAYWYNRDESHPFDMSEIRFPFIPILLLFLPRLQVKGSFNFTGSWEHFEAILWHLPPPVPCLV